MDNLLSVIAQLLEQKKYMSVKEIVSVENAADLAGVFDELLRNRGRAFFEASCFKIMQSCTYNSL